MKKILFGLFLTCTLFACTKDPNTPSGTSASGSISYKVNGSSMTINNVDLLSGQYVLFQKQLKGSVVPETRYLLNAQNGSNNVVVFALITDSLQTKTYSYDSAYVFSTGNLFNAISYNGQASSILRNGDYFNVSITSYANSRISGTFTAKLTPYTSTGTGPAGSTLITEGKIDNVQVIY